MTAVLLRTGNTQSFGEGAASFTERYFVASKFGNDAVLDVGIGVGQESGSAQGYFANGIGVSPADNGSGSFVDVTYSTTRRSGSTFEAYDVVADLDAYSYTIGFEEREHQIPTISTVEVVGTDANGDAVLQSRWGDIEYAPVTTTFTRIGLRTTATTAQLGINSNKAESLNAVLGITDDTNVVLTVGASNRNWLFRVDRIEQASTPANGDFATARWDVEYTLLYDPGDRGPIGSLVANVPKAALFGWTRGNGQGTNDAGKMLPWVPPQYGPGQNFNRPPYCTVDVYPSEVANPTTTLDRARVFRARPLYEESSADFFNLPGVP
jgi:hypothetical protein